MYGAVYAHNSLFYYRILNREAKKAYREYETLQISSADADSIKSQRIWNKAKFMLGILRIRMFLDLPDPDPLVRYMDADPASTPAPFPDPLLFS